MLSFSISNNNIKFFHDNLPEIEPKLFEASYISCFVCQINHEHLAKHWEHIASLIATYHQAELDDNLKIWNIYLVFVLSETISKSLRYQIENDKFSMRKLVIERKLVIDQLGANISDEEMIEIINNELLGHDLVLTQENSSIDLLAEKSYVRTQVEMLGKIPLSNKSGDPEKRLEQLNKLAKVLFNEN